MEASLISGKGDDKQTRVVLKKYRSLVLDVVGSESAEEQVEEACLLFLKDLIRLKNVTLDLMKKYKKSYGTVTPAQVEKIHRALRELHGLVAEHLLDTILGSHNPPDDNYFGSKIKFSYKPCLPTDEEMNYLRDISKKTFSLQSELTFDYETNLVKTVDKGSSGGVNAVDMRWLENTVRSYYGEEKPLGMSAPEFAVTIMEKINAKKSVEELQTELFDLCGFDRFDMIGAILEKRKELVQSFKVLTFYLLNIIHGSVP